jgi:hypothetical protein
MTSITEFNASLRDMNDNELEKNISEIRSAIFEERGKISQFGMGSDRADAKEEERMKKCPFSKTIPGVVLIVAGMSVSIVSTFVIKNPSVYCLGIATVFGGLLLHRRACRKWFEKVKR